MRKNEQLNEVMIQYALLKGLITSTEAREMLMLYVNKSWKIQRKPTKFQSIPKSLSDGSSTS